MQRRARDLRRIDNARLHQIGVFIGGNVVTFVAFALLHFLDNERAFCASVIGKLTRRFLNGAAHDLHADFLVGLKVLHVIERFLRTQKVLDNIKDLEADEKVGVAIVRRAVEEPTRQLADNAGKEGALVVEEVKKRKGNEGYDVSADEYTDLVKAGIVDPTKVARTALQNAASISGLLLTTEALVTEIPEKEKTPPMPGGGMGGMGGMDY